MTTAFSISMTSATTSPASSKSPEPDVTISLLKIRECFIYRVPARGAAAGYRAESWGLATPLATVQLEVKARGDDILLQFAKAIAACFLHRRTEVLLLATLFAGWRSVRGKRADSAQRSQSQQASHSVSGARGRQQSLLRCGMQRTARQTNNPDGSRNVASQSRAFPIHRASVFATRAPRSICRARVRSRCRFTCCIAHSGGGVFAVRDRVNMAQRHDELDKRSSSAQSAAAAAAGKSAGSTADDEPEAPGGPR